MKRNRLCGSLIAALLVTLAAPLAAHPHVVIDAWLAFDWVQGHPQILTCTWAFDKAFSESVFQDIPKPPSGKFTQTQIKALRDGYFSNLENYGYFLRISQDGKTLTHPQIVKFDAREKNGKLVYEFAVKIPKPSGPVKEHSLTAACFDDTFFVAFTPMGKAEITMTGDPAKDLTFSVTDTVIQTEDWGEQTAAECRMVYHG